MRHGRTEWNIEGKLQGRLNSPLLPESITVIKKIADFLYDKNVAIIYSSPLMRCEETAKTVTSALCIPYTLDECLVECDHGLCEGLTLDEAHIKYSRELEERERDKWNTPWVGGESYSDVFERAKTFSVRIDPSQNALVIAHETFNKCLIGLLMKWTSSQIMAYRQANNVICQIGDHKEFNEILL
jgi:probable phosphoglycerate mutase